MLLLFGAGGGRMGGYKLSSMGGNVDCRHYYSICNRASLFFRRRVCCCVWHSHGEKCRILVRNCIGLWAAVAAAALCRKEESKNISCSITQLSPRRGQDTHREPSPFCEKTRREESITFSVCHSDDDPANLILHT